MLAGSGCCSSSNHSGVLATSVGCSQDGYGGARPSYKAYKKAELSQSWPRDAPYIWVPWKFSGVPDYGSFARNFYWTFVPIDTMNVRTELEVHSFTCAWDNRGYLNILDSPWIHPRSLFSNILMGFGSDGPCECTGQICSLYRFNRSWDNMG